MTGTTESSAAGGTATTTTLGGKFLSARRYVSVTDAGLLIIFAVLVIVLTIVSPRNSFMSVNNIFLILMQTAINGILAMGMTYVMIGGEFDLSVGSIVGLAGVSAAMLAHPGEYPLFLPIIVGVVVGLLVGLVNGIGIAYGGIPSFIMTLGTLTGIRGLALVVSGGAPVAGLSDPFRSIASERLFGVPILAVYLVAIVIITIFVMRKTVFGRRIYAMGGNPEAAEVSGINVKRLKVATFVISGALAGLAGVLLASRTFTGSPTAGDGYELDAIAAVVIGGVSMAGGRGRPFGVLIGALLLAVIANGLDIMGINSNAQRLIKGAIIVLAVLIDVKTRKN